MDKLVVGLDIGTGGARAMGVDSTGTVLFAADHPIPKPRMDAEGASEQDPEFWGAAALGAVESLAGGLRDLDGLEKNVEAICIDATSGAIAILDDQDRPLYPGLMHNDTRAHEEAAFLNDSLADHCAEVGYRFGATFSLPKLLWLRDNHPSLFGKAKRVVHQADYVVGRLTGEYSISDPANALKTGYNLTRNEWPTAMDGLGVSHLLPEVVPSGTVIGTLLPSVASRIGLPPRTKILAGLTDSNAAFQASGARDPGQFCVTLGTTMAFKGIAKSLVHDPSGGVYCHRHPSGDWLPGAASNVGGACLKHFFLDRNFAELDRGANTLFPQDAICYPLVEVGERFPFASSNADGFFEDVGSEEERYLSLLQGVALVEKWCFENFSNLGVNVVGPIYTAGGGSKSDTWNQIRADILQIPTARCESGESAFGMAVLAGASVFYEGDLSTACREMTRTARVYEPNAAHANWAGERLECLQDGCRKRGWIA